MHANMLTKKWWEKTRETIFPETHQQSERKMLGKKSSQKSAKKYFLNLHEYRDQKKGGKNAPNNISRNTPIVRAKKCWEKNLRKKLRNIVFYINSNIVTKQWWKKRGKQLFQKHQ